MSTESGNGPREQSPVEQVPVEQAPTEPDGLSRGAKIGLAAGGAVALVVVGVVIGSQFGGSGDPAVASLPTTEDRANSTGEQTNDPGAGETIQPGEKIWEAFEIPEADRAGFRDFGSKEDFLNWFMIDAGTYTTPEDIAKKHVQNLEALMMAGLTYQSDGSLVEQQNEPTMANIYREYDLPIFERIMAPGVEGSNILPYNYKLESGSMFLISYYDREDPVPYAMKNEYYSSELLWSDAEDFADATEFRIRINSGDSENTFDTVSGNPTSIAEWRRAQGKPAVFAVDYIDDMTFTLHEATNIWQVANRVNVEVTRKDIP